MPQLGNSRIAAFNVVEAELVEPPGDGELIFERKTNALGLHTIPKRRIVNHYLFHKAGHCIRVIWACKGTNSR